MQHTPVVSFVLVGRDGLASIASVLACLSEQTMAGAAEVVVVIPDAVAPRSVPDRYLAAFATFKVVAVPEIRSRGEAVSAGIRATTSPIISLVENHCFPEPDCFETVLSEFECADKDVVGIVPAINNANPESAVGTAVYFITHADFSDAQPGGYPDEVPAHHISFRREALMRHEPELDALMQNEAKLQERMRAEGGRFLFQPEAKSRHLNNGVWFMATRVILIGGRQYAASRAKDWSLGRRLTYAALFPALGLKVFSNTLKTLRKTEPERANNAKLLVATFGVSMLQALGEAAGYIVGSPRIYPFLLDEEFMVVERTAGQAMKDPWIAHLVSLGSPLAPKQPDRTVLRPKPVTASL